MSHITEIIDASLAGKSIAFEQAVELFAFAFGDAWSQDAFYLRWAARKLAVQASKGRGSLYAQIGIDAGPCPDNCTFCTFAAQNIKNMPPHDTLDIDTVVKISKVFAEEGIDWISLMTTSAFDFDTYLEIVSTVRSQIPRSTRIMSNIGDMSLEQAKRCKAAGVEAAYHAPRLGEGNITRCNLDTRYQTMDNIRDAGLLLSSGVEPIRISTTAEELAERTLRVLAYNPFCAGTVPITIVKGTATENEQQPSLSTRRLLACAFRIIAGGHRVPFGNFNSAWADAGARPRGKDYAVSRKELSQRVCRARKALIDNDWM